MLERVKNMVLTGPPGTGKTYLARRMAMKLVGVDTDEQLAASGQFGFVQFHPSYDYTDFVEGLRPVQSDDNGNVGFELRDGVFKQFCRKAMEKGSMARLDEAIERFKDDCSETPVKVKNKSGSAANWWMRSPWPGNSISSCYVGSTGNAIYGYAATSIGVAFGFCT